LLEPSQGLRREAERQPLAEPSAAVAIGAVRRVFEVRRVRDDGVDGAFDGRENVAENDFGSKPCKRCIDLGEA
jgi:hypothetical protein